MILIYIYIYILYTYVCVYIYICKNGPFQGILSRNPVRSPEFQGPGERILRRSPAVPQQRLRLLQKPGGPKGPSRVSGLGL